MKRFLTLLIILAIFGAGFLLVKKGEEFMAPYLKKVFQIEEKIGGNQVLYLKEDL